jgi:chain length determinant protein (polysaccharide antigen chain regulator)
MNHNQPNQNVAMYQLDEEINLGELFLKLAQRKYLILTITALFSCLALIIALITKPIYQVEAFINMPQNADITKLNINGLTEYNPHDAFKLYYSELKSKANQQAFFKQYNFEQRLSKLDSSTLSLVEVNNVFNQFIASLNIVDNTPNYLKKVINGKVVEGSEAIIEQAHIFSLTHHPEVLVEFINGYLEFVNQQLLSSILADQSTVKDQQLSKLSNQEQLALTIEQQQRALLIARMQNEDNTNIAMVEDEIQVAINKYQAQMDTKLAQLNEALAIAKTLAIRKPTNLDDFNRNNNKQIEINNSNNQQQKMYLLGSEFLEAEINEVSKRQQDINFVPGLADLKAKLAATKINRQLEALKNREDARPYIENFQQIITDKADLTAKSLDFKDSRFYQPLQLAFVPNRAVKPNKKLILAIGIVAGFFLGLFIALMHMAITNYKEKNSQASV